MLSAGTLSGCAKTDELPKVKVPKDDDKDGNTDKDGGGKGDKDKDKEKEDPGCKSDLSCRPGEYCERASGDCRVAIKCDYDSGEPTADCDFFPDGDPANNYCANGRCFCDPEWGGGSCRPVVPSCQSCTTDAECGNDFDVHGFYGGVSKCVELNPEEGKVCLLEVVPGRNCGAGFKRDTDLGLCVPRGGSCTGVSACERNSDCDPNSDKPVCDTQLGQCAEACEFDYSNAHSDCPAGNICHVYPPLLSPSNPNFGGGSCGRPCDSLSSPFVCGEGTECVSDGDSSLIEHLPQRCRPELPSCIRDADCPRDDDTYSVGWCDKASLECRGGCQSDKHCFNDFRCVEGECIEKTCIEKGGANLACEIGEFCCGEEGGVQCPVGVPVGECYVAPEPQWCGAPGCDGNNSWSADTPIGYDASSPPRPQDSRCIPTDGGEGQQPMQWHSCDPMTAYKHCPRGFQCKGFLQFCDTDADCGSAGTCSDVNGPYGAQKACTCMENETCPEASECFIQEADPETGSEEFRYCQATWCMLDRCFPDPEPEPDPDENPLP